MALSGIEFLLGFFMATGCYKRTSAWLMSLIMLGMLPLTLYIWIADPVSDCGGFGDFLVISNFADIPEKCGVGGDACVSSVQQS